jgi:hypothetical protein
MTERAMSKHNNNQNCNSRPGIAPIPSRDNKLQVWASTFQESVVLNIIFVICCAAGVQYAADDYAHLDSNML